MKPLPLATGGTSGSNPSPSSAESIANSERHVVTVTTQILKPLLKLQGLRAAGAPEYDGTFPQTLQIAANI